MSVLDLVRRLLRTRVPSAAILSALVLHFHGVAGAYRLPGAWYAAFGHAGLALFALSVLLVVHRIATTTPPAPLRPLAPHGTNFILLGAVDLAILSLITPVLRAAAGAPLQDPVSRRALESAAGLSGLALVAIFTIGAVVTAWILLLQILDATVLRIRAVRSLARLLDRVVVGVLLAYCLAGTVLAYNGAFDPSPPTYRPATLRSISSIRLPFGLGRHASAELLTERGVERVLLIPARDQLWPDSANAGLPLRVEVHRGLLGIPWVQAIAIDTRRQSEQILEALPAAAATRKTLIAALVEEGRWSDVRAHAEAHVRHYPGDGDYLLSLATRLRAAGRTADAVALERLARP